MKKRISKRVWYGDEVDEAGNAIPPELSSYDGALDGLNEGELFINNASEDPTIFIRDNKGKIIGFKVSSKIKLDELYDIFLRKDQPDTAKELITFLKGLVSQSVESQSIVSHGEITAGGLVTAGKGVQFGQSYASGLTGHGGQIDSLGRGELESLILRRFL